MPYIKWHQSKAVTHFRKDIPAKAEEILKSGRKLPKLKLITLVITKAVVTQRRTISYFIHMKDLILMKKVIIMEDHLFNIFVTYIKI